MTRGDLTDAERELIEPHLPLGAFGPIPDLRSHFNAVMWQESCSSHPERA
ncbi:transposase [Streptomyces sp. NPDC004129]